MTKITQILFLLSILALQASCGQGFEAPLNDRVVTATGPHGEKQNYPLREAVIQAGVPARAVDEAFRFFDQNQRIIENRSWLTIVDFTRHSGEPRMFVINLKNGQVDHLFTAHGKNSDPNDDGFPEKFSNIENSLMSSLGFYLVAERYSGKYGKSLRLDGLSPTNSLARRRAIVIHPANYVSANLKKMGRSWGCPAVEYSWISTVVDRLEGDSLMYAYHEHMMSLSALPAADFKAEREAQARGLFTPVEHEADGT